MEDHPPEDVTVTSLPVPEELLELKDAVLVALCGLHTPDIAFGGELEADLIADDTWSQNGDLPMLGLPWIPKKVTAFDWIQGFGIWINGFGLKLSCSLTTDESKDQHDPILCFILGTWILCQVRPEC